MNHSFDVDVAKKYGILEAVLLNNFEFWIEKNKANGTNFHDGRYWTYNTTAAFQKLFPYASQRQIERALKHLRDEGILLVGNYNEEKWDRTLWYALSDKVKCISPKREMDTTKMGNAFHQTVEPIPDINTDINTDINAYGNIAPPERESFVPPTVEEVEAYCKESGCRIDARRFVNYYKALGWRIGKNPIIDWKPIVQNWYSRDNHGEDVPELPKINEKERLLKLYGEM